MRIMTPPGQTTRPTTDRVKEAVFSSLVTWLSRCDESAHKQMDGIYFLDLFAGSGGVGLEAASRGAQVVMVDQSVAAIKAISSNSATTRLQNRCRYHQMNAIHWLERKHIGQPFDIVWADPPYEMSAEQVDKIVATLISQGYLADDGLVAIERSSRDRGVNWPDYLNDSWERKYGETTVYYAAHMEQTEV